MESKSTFVRKLVWLLLALPLVVGIAPAQASRRADCSQESIGLIPLNDLGTGTYRGEQGGLYPGGSNEIPPEHQALGLSLAASVGPLNAGGEPDPEGRIGFIGIGVSTTMRDWEGFESVALSEPDVNPQIVFVNGGVSGHPITQWLQLSDFPWGYLDDQVAAAGLTPEQIQVAWVMLPERPVPPPPFPERQEAYSEQLKVVLGNLKQEYPNLLLAYLSSHQYAGFGTENITEPGNGYEHGFGVKWTVEAQIEGEEALNADPALGPLRVPWIAWGPYTWADGSNPRSDGLTWVCSDFAFDGTHPSDAGALKTGTMLLEFLMSEPTAVGWFLGEGVEPRPPVTTAPASSTTTSVHEVPTTQTPTTPTTTPVNTRPPQSTLAGERPRDETGEPPWLLIAGVGVVGLAIGAVAARRSRDRG